VSNIWYGFSETDPLPSSDESDDIDDLEVAEIAEELRARFANIFETDLDPEVSQRIWERIVTDHTEIAD
jgi:hypothetical protein